MHHGYQGDGGYPQPGYGGQYSSSHETFMVSNNNPSYDAMVMPKQPAQPQAPRSISPTSAHSNNNDEDMGGGGGHFNPGQNGG